MLIYSDYETLPRLTVWVFLFELLFGNRIVRQTLRLYLESTYFYTCEVVTGCRSIQMLFREEI